MRLLLVVLCLVPTGGPCDTVPYVCAGFIPTRATLRAPAGPHTPPQTSALGACLHAGSWRASVLLPDGRHQTVAAEITVEGGDGAWGAAGGLRTHAGAESLIESAASPLGSANVRFAPTPSYARGVATAGTGRQARLPAVCVSGARRGGLEPASARACVRAGAWRGRAQPHLRFDAGCMPLACARAFSRVLVASFSACLLCNPAPAQA